MKTSLPKRPIPLSIIIYYIYFMGVILNQTVQGSEGIQATKQARRDLKRIEMGCMYVLFDSRIPLFFPFLFVFFVTA